MAKQLTLLETIFLANEYGVVVTFKPDSPVQTELALRVVSDVAGLICDSFLECKLHVPAMDSFKDPNLGDHVAATHILDGLKKLRAMTGAEG